MSSFNKAKQHFVGPRCDPQNKDSHLSCNSQKYNYICSINMVFKSKNGSKLNSTEMDFWGRSAQISRKYKIRNIIIK